MTFLGKSGIKLRQDLLSPTDSIRPDRCQRVSYIEDGKLGRHNYSRFLSYPLVSRSREGETERLAHFVLHPPALQSPPVADIDFGFGVL